MITSFALILCTSIVAMKNKKFKTYSIDSNEQQTSTCVVSLLIIKNINQNLQFTIFFSLFTDFLRFGSPDQSSNPRKSSTKKTEKMLLVLHSIIKEKNGIKTKTNLQTNIFQFNFKKMCLGKLLFNGKMGLSQ